MQAEVAVAGALSELCEAAVEGQEVSRDLWTPDELERLRELAQAGMSLTELAREMGRSMSSIRTRAEKLNITIARDMNRMRRRRLDR